MLKSLCSNIVNWDLVRVLEGINLIRCKKIYKRKKGVYGKVKTYLARVVTKDYSLKHDFDHGTHFHC